MCAVIRIALPAACQYTPLGESSQIKSINYIIGTTKKEKKQILSSLSLRSLVILSAALPLPLTRTQGNMKQQTMNMTKCEIPQPLSRSHFPGSC